jgi:hypothetical protein
MDPRSLAVFLWGNGTGWRLFGRRGLCLLAVQSLSQLRRQHPVHGGGICQVLVNVGRELATDLLRDDAPLQQAAQRPLLGVADLTLHQPHVGLGQAGLLGDQAKELQTALLHPVVKPPAQLVGDRLGQQVILLHAL